MIYLNLEDVPESIKQIVFTESEADFPMPQPQSPIASTSRVTTITDKIKTLLSQIEKEKGAREKIFNQLTSTAEKIKQKRKEIEEREMNSKEIFYQMEIEGEKRKLEIMEEVRKCKLAFYNKRMAALEEESKVRVCKLAFYKKKMEAVEAKQNFYKKRTENLKKQ